MEVRNFFTLVRDCLDTCEGWVEMKRTGRTLDRDIFDKALSYLRASRTNDLLTKTALARYWKIERVFVKKSKLFE